MGHTETESLEQALEYAGRLREMLGRGGMDPARAAYQTGVDQLRRGNVAAAEILFLETVEADDPAVAARASVGLGRIRECTHGDFAGARQFYTDALMHTLGREPELAAAARADIDRAAELFVRLSEPPSRRLPSVPALGSTEYQTGATPEQVAEALRSGDLRLPADAGDHAVTIVGTLVKDDRGRYGIRDETTGLTTLVDFPWSRQWVESEASRDLGQTVRASGTVATLERPVAMRLRGYHAARDLMRDDGNLRHGLRFTEFKARELAGARLDM